MVIAREIGRGKIREDFLPHTKEFGHDSVHKRSHCKFLSQGMAGTDKEFKKITLKVWRMAQREVN